MRIHQHDFFVLRCRTILFAAFVAASCLGGRQNVATAAPPQADYLFPAGGQKGTTVDVTVAGTFDPWPVEVWTNRSDVQVTPQQDKGKLQIVIAADAQSGIAWMRLYNDEGAANLRPFLIGSLPEQAEAEPNDSPGQMAPVELPRVVNGRLQKSGDLDGFAVQLKAGQTLTAAVQANSLLDSPVDAVVQICELIERPATLATPAYEEAFVVAQNHDEVGLDPCVTFQTPRDGKFAVRLFAYPAQPDSSIRFFGGDSSLYRLTLTTDALEPTHVLPEVPSTYSLLTAEPDKQPQGLSLPTTIRGQFLTAGQSQLFSFTAKKGEKFSLQGMTRPAGWRTALSLRIIDAEGNKLAEAPGGDPKKETTLDFTAPADGSYQLQTSDAFGRGDPRLRYQLNVAPQLPDFALTVESDHFVVRADKPLEIPVTIDRRFKFAEEIEIQLVNLPDGVTCEPAVSLDKGDTAKSVKLAVQCKADAKPQSLQVKIVGKAPQGEHTATFASSLPLDQPHESLWLTVRP